MAGINKNFKVQNGLEVASNLIIADAVTKKVAIGGTGPRTQLDVRGGFISTDSYVSGISTVAGSFYVGSNTLTALVGSGSVGVGTALPQYLLDVRSSVSTGQTALYVRGDARVTGNLDIGGDVTLDEIFIRNITVSNQTTTQNLSVSGIATIAALSITTLGVSGFTTTQNLSVSGITTLGVTSATNLTSQNLTVSGITTLGTVQISSGIVTATSGIVTYYGDGSKLTNVTSGVGIKTTGSVIGFGATILDFRGAGISTITVASGIATINITGGGGGGGSIGIGSVFPVSSTNGNLFYNIDYGRTFVYYDEVALGIGATAVWVDAAPFNQGGLFVSKYGDNMYAGLGVTTGSASSPSVYFNGYTNTGFYSPAANEFGVVVSGTQRLNVNSGGINVTGVATAASFRGGGQVGVATGGSYIGLATQFNFVGSGIGISHAYNSTVGIATITLFAAAASGGGGSGLFNTGISSSVGYAVTTTMATAYTAPATVGAEHIVHSIHVTNIDGTNSADVSGQLYSGQFSIAHLVPVPAGSSVELLKQPKILAANETIQLQASADSRLHATITVETKAGDTTYIGVGTDITSAATYTDLWIATSNSMLQGILLANDDGTADVKARVVWTDGSNNIIGYYAYDMVIPADATVEILEQPKYLPNGFKVRVYANQANRLEAILSARTIA
jgi:hypothetical protein